MSSDNVSRILSDGELSGENIFLDGTKIEAGVKVVYRGQVRMKHVKKLYVGAGHKAARPPTCKHVVDSGF